MASHSGQVFMVLEIGSVLDKAGPACFLIKEYG